MSSQAPIALMVAGYRGAVDRLTTVLRNADANADDAFVPLFEALNWAASIDLFLVDVGTPVQDDLLTGVRFLVVRCTTRLAAECSIDRDRGYTRRS